MRTRLWLATLTLVVEAGCAGAAAQNAAGDAGLDAARADPRTTVCANPAAATPPYELVQAIFNDNCTSCHASGPMVDLSAGRSWNNLVGKPAPAPETCGALLVVPGQPSKSYLLQKLTDPAPCYGQQMPLGEFESQPLSDCVVTIVRAWIDEGAPPPESDAGVDLNQDAGAVEGG